MKKIYILTAIAATLLLAACGKKEREKVPADITANVYQNNVFCENEKILIKVDFMKDGSFRYTSWNKPKTESDEPDLILHDGIPEKQGTDGGIIYTFEDGMNTYIVEDWWLGDSSNPPEVFLRELNDGEEASKSKMKKIGRQP